MSSKSSTSSFSTEQFQANLVNLRKKIKQHIKKKNTKQHTKNNTKQHGMNFKIFFKNLRNLCGAAKHRPLVHR